MPDARKARRRRAERACWALLLLVNLVTHLYALDRRALSHDESLHAFYSWKLARQGEYQHDPAYHGPLLYHVVGLTFATFGDDDLRARIPVALSGITLVGCCALLRRRLGAAGALAAALLLTLSPSFLFYGRYLRNDVPVALLNLIWCHFAFRYLEQPRSRWLLATVAFMALGFAAKETSALFGVTLGVFLLYGAARRDRAGELPRARQAALALSMFTFALPFATPLALLPWGGWDAATTPTWQAAGVLAAAIATSLLLAVAAFGPWKRRLPGPPSLGLWLALAVLFWGTLGVLYSGLLRHPQGVTSGFVGSLGYWMGQHEVARGGQPWSYYLVQAALYEPLASGLAVTALVSLARRSGPHRPLIERTPFLRFLAWWLIASVFLYSFAGERMPWLLTHPVLPACLLGGAMLGALAQRGPRAVRRNPAAVLVAPLLAYGLLRTLTAEAFNGLRVEDVADTWRALSGAGALVGGLMLLRHVRRRAEFRLAFALGVVLLAALHTGRAAFGLAFVRDELPSETLVYAHATPDVKRALREIDRHLDGDQTGPRTIAYSQEVAWPFAWYLRGRSDVTFLGPDWSSGEIDAAAVLVGTEGRDRAWSLLRRGYERRDYVLLWWPVASITRFGRSEVLRFLSDVDGRRRIIAYLMDRDTGFDLASWPQRREFSVYLKTGAVPDGDEPLLREVRVEPVARLDAFAGLGLRVPAQVSLGPRGLRALADSGNDRVVVFDRAGSVVRVIGGRCHLDTGADCRDPDSMGPLLRGDGQFHEPWGVTFLADGRLAVADTWNGRIQVFDARGRFLTKWGHPSLEAVSPADPSSFYGPRALVEWPAGRIAVADTGHKRVSLFTAAGEPLGTTSRAGTATVVLDEPVGLAVGAPDTLLIADAWNGRIRQIGPGMQLRGDHVVPGWGARGALAKPYLAVGESGWIFATDPDHARIIVFDATGAASHAIVAAGWRSEPPAAPVGIAVDTATRELLVTDVARGALWIMPAVTTNGAPLWDSDPLRRPGDQSPAAQLRSPTRDD